MRSTSCPLLRKVTGPLVNEAKTEQVLGPKSGSISQDTFDRVVRWPALKVQKTNRGNLMRGKTRVFGVQVNDQLAHLFRKTAPGLRGRSALFGEQADHTLLLKLLCLVLQGAWTGPDFFGAFSRALVKKHNGAQPLILLLFRPERILLNLLPVVGAFSSLPLACRHDDHLFAVFSLPRLLCRFVRIRVTLAPLMTKH